MSIVIFNKLFYNYTYMYRERRDGIKLVYEKRKIRLFLPQTYEVM